MDDCLPAEWRETPKCKASLQHSAMQLKLLISMYKNEELDNMNSLNLTNLMKFPIPPYISKNWIDPSPKRPASSKPKSSIKTRSTIPRKSSAGSFIGRSLTPKTIPTTIPTTISTIPTTIPTKSESMSSPTNLWAMTAIKIGPGLKNSSIQIRAPSQAIGSTLSNLKLLKTTPVPIVNLPNRPKKRGKLEMAGGLVPTKTSGSSQEGLQMAHDDVVWGLNQTKNSVLGSVKSPTRKSTSPVRSPTKSLIKISPQSSTRTAIRSFASLEKSSPTSIEKSLGISSVARSIEKSLGTGKSLERSLQRSLENPARSPARSPVTSPVISQAKSTARSSSVSTGRSLLINPTRSPVRTSVKSTAGSPLLSTEKNIAINPTRSPARTLVKSPTRSLARSAPKSPPASLDQGLSISPLTSFVLPPKRKLRTVKEINE